MDLTKKYLSDTLTDLQTTNIKPLDKSIEIYLMNNSLEFLKITSLIKYRLYSQEMPWIVSYQFAYKNLRQINFLF